mmetsp:Transcript_78955/g.210916  ORF Transcript_78955/g.210916 Transcript_78955/m.210916 type:complete len:303 (-) Transcript_78955:105-1013(-)
MTDSSLLGLTMLDSCETAVVDEGDWTNDRVAKAAVRLQEGLSFLVQPTGLYQDANEYTGVRVLQPVPQADENEPPPMKRSELGRGEKIGLYLASVGFIVTTLCILLNALPLALLGMVLAAVGSSVYFVAHMKSVRGSNWEPLRETIEEIAPATLPHAALELNSVEQVGLVVASVGYMVMTVCIILNALPLALLGMMGGAAGASVYFLAHMNKQQAQRAASRPADEAMDWDRVERIGLNLASAGYSIMAVFILLNALPAALIGMVLGVGGACAFCIARVKKQGREPAELETETTEELENLCES